MISLLNKTRQPEIINLAHSDMCDEGDCSCVKSEHRQLQHNARTGEVKVKVIPRSISGSIHLLPNVWSDPLPDYVADVARVAALLKTRKLVKKVITAPAPAPAPAAPESPAAPAPAPAPAA